MILQEVKAGEKMDAPFAKKKEDVLDGDIVKILADVEERQNNFNPTEMQKLIKIETRNGARWTPLNQTSINILINEFKTNDSSKWVGKEAKILLLPGVFAGKKGYALYLAGKDWELDEFGSPVRSGDVQEEPAEMEEVVEEGTPLDQVPF